MKFRLQSQYTHSHTYTDLLGEQRVTHLSSCPKTIKINARRSAQSDTRTHSTTLYSLSLSLSLAHTHLLSCSLLPLLLSLSLCLPLPAPLQFVQAAVVVVVIKNPFRPYIMTGTPPMRPLCTGPHAGRAYKLLYDIVWNLCDK